MRFSTRIFRVNGLLSDVQQLCFFKLKQTKKCFSTRMKFISRKVTFLYQRGRKASTRTMLLLYYYYTMLLLYNVIIILLLYNVMSHETKLDHNHAMQLMIKTSQNITVIYYTARRVTMSQNAK